MGSEWPDKCDKAKFSSVARGGGLSNRTVLPIIQHDDNIENIFRVICLFEGKPLKSSHHDTSWFSVIL